MEYTLFELAFLAVWSFAALIVWLLIMDDEQFPGALHEANDLPKAVVISIASFGFLIFWAMWWFLAIWHLRQRRIERKREPEGEPDQSKERAVIQEGEEHGPPTWINGNPAYLDVYLTFDGWKDKTD